ncbi:hypothetical protein VOLCADRAFT_42270, partial [Volvox carteri f. nagariensis]
FRGQMSGSESLIYRMELQRNLEGHGGCVNTVSFNPTGDLLVSGSDDQSVMLWDWRRGLRRLRFEPGHTNNIFQASRTAARGCHRLLARFLPGSHDKTLVSCAADGQVRVSYFREGSSRPFTKRLHRHMGRAHKLALQHASPYNPSYGGGACGGPPCFYSSGEDGDVCLFDLRMCDSEPLARMAASATGSHQSRQIIDLNAIHVNPARPWQLVVGGADEAVVVYDNRSLTSLTSSYGGSSARGDPGAVRRRPAHVTCVMFGQNGDVLATYNDDDVYLFRPPGTQGSADPRVPTRVLSPLLPSARSGHRNRQTVKGVNFLGEREEWVVSGSDCGHIYIWSRDSCRLHCWLRGDTHVVNCLEPHPSLPLHMATSGIDDDIKLWAPTAECPHTPGPSAHATMESNSRQRAADHSRV